MILMSSSSTSSVVIPSARSILRNSFIPLIKRLHSKSVSFSLVFLLNIKITSLYLVIPFYKEVCVLSNVRILYLIFYNSFSKQLLLLYCVPTANSLFRNRHLPLKFVRLFRNVQIITWFITKIYFQKRRNERQTFLKIYGLIL